MSQHCDAGSRWSTSGTPSNQAISTTQKIKSISREARQNELISERLNEWQAKMRGRGVVCLHRKSGVHNLLNGDHQA